MSPVMALGILAMAAAEDTWESVGRAALDDLGNPRAGAAVDSSGNTRDTVASEGGNHP
jgi:hypothetical protein